MKRTLDTVSTTVFDTFSTTVSTPPTINTTAPTVEDPTKRLNVRSDLQSLSTEDIQQHYFEKRPSRKGVLFEPKGRYECRADC